MIFGRIFQNLPIYEQCPEGSKLFFTGSRTLQAAQQSIRVQISNRLNWRLSWCICSVQFFCLTVASPKLNFLGSFWKSFSSKHEVLSEYSKLTLSFIFQNHNFFRFSWDIIGLVCHIVTIFLPTQRSRLSKPSRFFKRVRKAYRKFSRDIWKKKFLLEI